MQQVKQKEVWLVTGSQHLYGPKVLETVAGDSQTIVKGLNETGKLPVNMVFKPVVKTLKVFRKHWKHLVPW